MAIRPVVIQISTRSLLTALSTLLITAQLPVLANEPAVRGWEAAPPAPAISLEKQAARKDELRLLPMTAVLDTATPNQNPRSVVSPMIAHPEGEAAEGQPEVTPHAITISRKDVLIQAGAGHHSADKFSKMELSGSATIEVTHDTISNTINSLV